MKALLITLLLLGLTGCSRPQELTNVFWNQQGPKPEIKEKTIQEKKEFQAGAESLSFQDQMLGPAKVEGAFVKTIQTGGGEDKYIIAAYLPNPSKKLIKQAEEMNGMTATVVPALQRFANRFKDYKYDGRPEVVIGTEKPNQAFWKVTYFNKQGLAFVVKVDQSYSIFSEEQVGSSFQEGTAWAYPDGPKHSEIGNVILRNLADDGGLIANLVSVQTESTNPVKESNHQYFFSPPDPKFDQVQVFYYINKAYDFFRDRLHANVPRMVKAIVHVGYPEKTNTAFYYSGQIRIGSGDDVSYTKIPLDPSVVMHEASHSLIDSVARLPFQGEGGSINEGFADFFACVQLKNPNMGEASYKLAPFKRTVANSMKLTERNGGLYHDSAVVSGTLWSIRDKLGEEKSLTFAMKVLNRLAPTTDFNFLAKTLANVGQTEFSGDDSNSINEVLKERGWL